MKLTTFHRHLKSHLYHSAYVVMVIGLTHLSASDSFTTMALYKFTYLLTYNSLPRAQLPVLLGLL